jgi:3-acetyloctanal aminotransferase
MKFAFLVHPLTEDSGRLTRYAFNAAFQAEWGNDPLALTEVLQQVIRHVPKQSPEAAPEPRIFDELAGLRTPDGRTAEGVLIEIPMDARAILEHQDRALEFISRAADMAIDFGARIIGLGSMTGVIGSRGEHLASKCPVAVTTGNSLTSYAALKNVLRAAAEFDIDLTSETVAVVGVPGSIASAMAGLLKPLCREILLVARQASLPARKLAEELGSELVLDLDSALDRAGMVVTATSAGNCIDQARLRPGSVVVDIGVPTDVRGTAPERADVLILSGGLVRLPETCRTNSKMVWLQQGFIPSCLGETIVLALDERQENYSLGRHLDLGAIRRIGATAEEMGFDFSKLVSFGRMLDDSQVSRFLKVRHRGQGRLPVATTNPSPEELAPLARERHARHINPVLIAAGTRSGCVRTFVRGDGMYLWDEAGRRYLDFVGGFGSVNLGHNPPLVADAITAALREQAPGFAQSAVNPYTASLARELVRHTPPGLEMVFFCNSGSEANEAALKLARAATGRPGFLSCDGSYHGKTIGSLSVTSSTEYRKPFGPLMPGCELVPYGDVAALERELSTRRYAAFLVEPLQAEGGMNVPPEGYFHEVQRICRATGTLLVVDEVQTGMGRTGSLFASDRLGIAPEVMTLAKSLGGGLMPVGAMICRRDLWLQAYGTVQSFALHTSTFSGGSLACAAGLAALRETVAQGLPERAAERGERLRAGLNALCRDSGLLKEARGVGLLCGLEFKKLPASLVAHWKNADPSGLANFVMPNSDRLIESIPVLHTMRVLLDEFGIYTQVARSNPFVMRLQPPLIVTDEQIDEVVEAIGRVTGQLDASNRLIEGMISKTVMGQHDGAQRMRQETLPAG